MGFVTRSVPVGHPDFGKSFPCVCQQDRIASQRSAQLRRLSNLDAVADKTFDTFILDPPGLDERDQASLRVSYDRAQEYANSPQGWVLFQGSFGSGKTHLAAAIANYHFARGGQVLFITAPDLLDHLRSTYGPSSEINYDEMFERVRAAPLLVLDDLGAESPTPWAREKLYQLINHRYLSRLPTIITTNTPLEELDPRVRSRIVDWNLTSSIPMNVPDFRVGAGEREPTAFADMNLYADMVFETFDLRQDTLPVEESRNLRHVFDAARDYAQNPDGWLLLTSGAHGCGKTHLAAAIANFRHQMGDHVVMVTASDLLDHFREIFSGSSANTLDHRFNDLKSAQLLVIDQLDLTNARPWAIEKIRQITNHRYLAKAPTVFTTTQALEDIDPVLQSRLLDTRRSRVLAILAPDYRGGIVPHRQWR